MNEIGLAASTRVIPANRRRLVFRVATGLAALVLAGLAVQDARSRARAGRELERLLADTGLARRQPDIAERVRRDPDPVRGRLGIARALLAESFDQKIFSRLPQREAIEEASRVGERLELARTLAEQAFPERPAAWQAPMIAGAATYRLWSMRGDPRLFSERAAWEGPLLAAAALAPGEDEPPRLLAWARLEIWPALSPAERQETRALLRGAFAEPATFERLASWWLDAAGGSEQAFAIVPDTPAAWAVLRRIFASRTDWTGFCAAHGRWRRALGRELDERLAILEAQLRGGDPVGARRVALGILATAPADGSYRTLIERTLALLPAGSAPVTGLAGLRAWLSWALDGTVRGETRLSPAAIARLEVSAGDLSAAERALAVLAAGDLAAAELIERRREDVNTEAWAPYFLAKARELARRGEEVPARAAHAMVHRSWRGSPVELETRVLVAEAVGDPSFMADAQAARTAAAGDRWAATDWRWRGTVVRLDLLPEAEARGLEIVFDVVPAGGVVVEVSIDGQSVQVVPVRPQDMLRIPVRLAPQPHLVEVRTLAGGRAVPGAVTLLTD
ncbi:MAG: hypothetical protein HY825_05985 [Acidobacteria bacterium]|nr:hypothetical protein [Acidobacteriota bacterium]